MSVPRRATAAGRLARLGFADPGRAERLIAEDLALDAEGADAGIVTALGGAADPDLAVAALVRMRPDGGLRAALRDDAALRGRLVAVLGVSAALGDHLTRHPGDWRLLAGPDPLAWPSPGQLRADLLAAVGADPSAAEPVAAEAVPAEAAPAERVAAAAVPAERGAAGRGGVGDPAVALRVAYRRHLLRIAAADLTGDATLDHVAAGLADLAGATLEAALAIARSRMPAGAAPCSLAVIAMGKCGARELNYASDVDVIFVAGEGPGGEGGGQAALRSANQLAAAMIRLCSEATSEGALFPVDPNLRPEGRQGPLVRTLASHLAYYQRWAKTWEFQALLKARPAAGDPAAGRAYMEAIAPLVWHAAERDNFVADVQSMRRRVIGALPAGEAGRQLKLGPGGLRDIEFAVQLLQLVHGRADESLREPATLPALAALAEGGYVGREDAANLAAAYRFLRTVEHLLQLRHLRRTHTLPEDHAVLRGLGRAMRAAEAGARPGAAGHEGPAARPAAGAGAAGESARLGEGAAAAGPPRAREQGGRAGAAEPGGAWLPGVARDAPAGDPAGELLAQWRRHAAEVRRLHEKLFYRPLLEAVARLPGEVARLTPQAARARLEALGYADPAGALRHMEALTAGVSRRAAIQRTLLPLMLGWFADSADPDAGLLAFRRVSDALGDSPWYLRLLRDDMTVAQRMARVLASSRYATDLLMRQPEMAAILAGGAQLAPRDESVLRAEAAAALRRHDAAADAAGAVRALRRRELLRAAVADLLDRSTIEETGETLTRITAITVGAALDIAARSFEAERGPLPTRMCVVAMGRFGGHETGYGSDADVMFVHEPLDGADEQAAARAAHAVAEELRSLLSRPAPDPPLIVDPDLRPEGRQGPLVRTLASYSAYYRRWSLPWEAQALLRAAPAAGDAGLGARFRALADGFRYPEGGVSDVSVREIKRIKARMEAERMPRGVEPALHLKLGPGGLSDVEWVAQLLQLRHAHAVPGLQTTRTLAALAAAAGAGLASPDDVAVLSASWQLAARIRNAITLVRGRASDVLPSRPSDLAAVASVLGYPPEDYQELTQDWRRAARRARAVMERLFYG